MMTFRQYVSRVADLPKLPKLQQMTKFRGPYKPLKRRNDSGPSTNKKLTTAPAINHVRRIVAELRLLVRPPSDGVTAMERKKFDHTLVLKIPARMRDEIDRALEQMADPFVNTRSEFLRVAADFALLSLNGEHARDRKNDDDLCAIC
jgi:hypothetical protein